MKEQCCSLLPAAGGIEKRGVVDVKQKMETPFRLPDGTDIKLGEEKCKAPEILFNPSKIGLEYMGIHTMLLNTIQKCDLELRKELFSKIYLSGGSTKFPHFPARLLNELREKKSDSIKVNQSFCFH